MTYTQLAKAWRAHRSAVAASRLEDDASLRQLLVAHQLQNEAEVAFAALTGAVPTDGASRPFHAEADTDQLRAHLAARRFQLGWGFCAALGSASLRAWRSLSLRRRSSLALAALALIAAPLVALAMAPKNLALGRTWTASSSDQGTAKSGRMRESDARFFFHTRNEQSPFLEIDLDRAKKIERVVVTNRPDCCATRALPLVLEASTDRKTWKQISRREQPFSRWQASFAPLRARWLRLSVPRVTALHLQNVAVY